MCGPVEIPADGDGQWYLADGKLTIHVLINDALHDASVYVMWRSAQLLRQRGPTPEYVAALAAAMLRELHEATAPFAKGGE